MRRMWERFCRAGVNGFAPFPSGAARPEVNEMVQERVPRISAFFLRFANPLLIAFITLASLFLLGEYFRETNSFIYTSPAQARLDDLVGNIYLACGIAVYFIIALLYERPIHAALSVIARGEEPPAGLLSLARIRAMNAPLIYAAITAGLWLFAMMLFPFVLTMASPPVLKSYWVTGMLLSFFIGSFILMLIYFSVGAVCRSRFLPRLFPLGHLDKQPGGHSISLRTRFLLVFVAICALPLLLNFFNTVIWRHVILPEAMERGATFTVEHFADLTISQTAYLCLFAFIMGLAIVFVHALQMRGELGSMGKVLAAVHSGDLSHHVRVTSRDELGKLGDCVNEMIIGLRERKRIVEAFNRYVDRTLTKQVLEGELAMGGVQLEVSILFCDIRGYTSISEGMGPDRMVALLNRYFTRMAGAIEEAGGSVNKFIGDAILAIFGAPEPRPDHRDRAIRASLAMYRALGEFNSEQIEDGLPELSIGIGLHSGLVLAGNIGTEKKIEYTVIGDPVNVAQRLQELTAEKGAPIICSGATLGPYKQRYAHADLGIVHLRGRKEPIDIYSLMPAFRQVYGDRPVRGDAR